MQTGEAGTGYRPELYETVLKKNGEPTADVTFRVIQDGKVLMTLYGVSNDNIRWNQYFLSVDAVSFPDIDADGYMDLITIASYDFASGPDVGKGFAEARIYRGNEYGYFVYERSMSENANSALADLTVRNVLDFLGAGRGQTSAGGQNSASGQIKPEAQEEVTAAKTGTAWKDAYINFSYFERRNQLCNSEGLMDYYYDLVFRL